MYITPDTYVKLVRFDVTPEHQLTFLNEQAQRTYFNNLNGLVLSDFTYQRKDNVIRYPALYEDIEKYNYLVYCNEAQSNKYYYCYITGMKYINDEMTEISIKTDVYQTWQFDIIYKTTFIEREHVNDDTIGANTVPESIETGEYIIDTYNSLDQMEHYCYLVQVTENQAGQQFPTIPYYTDLGGIATIGALLVFTDYSSMYTYLSNYHNQDAIFNCYLVPRIFVDHDFTPDPVTGEINHEFAGQSNPIIIHDTAPKPSSLNGYVPKNNKLFTYPYCYLILSNNGGGNNILHYEFFSGNDCEFMIEGVPTINGSIKCSPENYKGTTYNDLEGIMAINFPSLSWNKDNFAQWQLYNGNMNNAKGLLGAGTALASIIAIALSAPTAGASTLLGLTLMGAGGTATLVDAMHQYNYHKEIPDSAQGNIGNGDIQTASGSNKFFYVGMSVKAEFAKKIDDYFSMSGYKVNSLKLPNITGRLNWNYVKTIDCNIEGTEIPEKDIDELKTMFNKGITFWHNISTFRDYSQNNPIV